MDILSSLLSQNLTKKTDFERVQWLVGVMKWLQKPRTGDEKSTKIETLYTVRLKYILLMLQKNPDWKLNFVTTIRALLYKISSTSQFASIGFTSNSFLHEFTHRIQEKILPNNPVTDDLKSLIYEIFPNEDESLLVDFIDESVLTELVNLFNEDVELEIKLKKDILAASYILSVQILNNVFLICEELKYKAQAPEDLAEFQLEGLLREAQMNSQLSLNSEIYEKLVLIEKNVEQLYLSMQDSGVKIELVYFFQTQRRKIRRLKILLGFLNPQVAQALNIRLFISNLIIESYHQKSLRSFFSENLSLLTERIVQTNSHLGEHYVTFNWIEFRHMMKSAMGGGALTALTVFIKLGITQFKLLGFIKGFAEGLNYSASFLGIQLLGFTLATKQPSATAPFIAAALKKSTTEARRSIVALLRTQFIAVIGNLITVFPICFIVSALILEFRTPFLESHEALEVLHSTNFFGSAPIYAAFTGVLLFSSSLIAGWIENWFTINQMQKRIKYNAKFKAWFGAARSEKLADFIMKNSNPLAANISLGFLLGLTPQVVKFFGIPAEVKHVTLATGSFATALPQLLQMGVSSLELVHSVAGLMVIGVLNISVSFLIAFLLASISSHVKFASFARLFRTCMRLVLTKPWLLVVPEKNQKNSVVVQTTLGES